MNATQPSKSHSKIDDCERVRWHGTLKACPDLWATETAQNKIVRDLEYGNCLYCGGTIARMASVTK